MFLAGTFSGLISALARFIVTMIGVRQLMPEFGEVPGMSGIFGAAGLLGALCSAPLTGLFTLLSFMLSVAIIHGTAKFLGGQGTFDRMAYSFGAVVAPLTLISAVLVPLNFIPYMAFCLLPLLVIFGLYGLYLQLAAIKAVYQFGWGGAAAAFFLPTILLSLLCAVLVVGLLSLAGPSFQEFLREMQQLQP